MRLHCRFHRDWHAFIVDRHGYTQTVLLGLHFVRDLPENSRGKAISMFVGPLQVSLSWGVK